MLEDAAPMAAAEHLGQAVMEFDSSATVETVVIDGEAQAVEEVEVEEVATEITEETEAVTPKSDEQSDETK
jgi:segregation and condensation protein B